jgi:hypothetical protein
MRELRLDQHRQYSKGFLPQKFFNSFNSSTPGSLRLQFPLEFLKVLARLLSAFLRLSSACTTAANHS